MCCICGDTFAQPSQLKSHVDDHTGGKPHECPVCKEKFKRKVDLNKHKSVHKAKELQDWLGVVVDCYEYLVDDKYKMDKDVCG